MEKSKLLSWDTIVLTLCVGLFIVALFQVIGPSSSHNNQQPTYHQPTLIQPSNGPKDSPSKHFKPQNISEKPDKASSAKVKKSHQTTEHNLKPRLNRLQINPNTATLQQLDQLPGIGPTLAQRIIIDRANNGPFTHPSHLKRIKGIGKGHYNKIKPYLKLDD